MSASRDNHPRLLEDFTADRARKGIENLIKLTPKTARVNHGGRQEVVPAEEVREGEILTVLAGETIPVDGILLSGETSVDQSVMTGESIPVDKKAGDELISGTVNQFGTFEMKATKACADSSLQRMIAIAEDALALGTAYAGIAMGGIGSDIAVESADAVLVSDNIKRLPYLFHIARKAMFKVKQNIIISLIINFTAIGIHRLLNALQTRERHARLFSIVLPPLFICHTLHKV